MSMNEDNQLMSVNTAKRKSIAPWLEGLISGDSMTTKGNDEVLDVQVLQNFSYLNRVNESGIRT